MNIDLDCLFPQYSSINLVSELMAKDHSHDWEIDELQIWIKRLEKRELQFRRRRQRYEEDIRRREKQGHERFDFYGGIPEFDGKVQDEEFLY